MKNKFLKITGLIAICLAISFSLQACNKKSEDIEQKQAEETKKTDEKTEEEKEKIEKLEEEKKKEEKNKKDLEEKKKLAQEKLKKAKTKEEKIKVEKEIEELKVKEQKIDEKISSTTKEITKAKESYRSKNKTSGIASKPADRKNTEKKSESKSTIKNKNVSKENKTLEKKETPNTKNKPIEGKKPEVKPTRPSLPKDKYTYKNTSSTSSIPFKTIDNYSSSGGKTKVIRNGVQGTKLTTYKITYKNGIETNKETISTKVTKEPIDKIIARYVKVQDEKYENKKVDDRSKPIYEYTYKERWFVATKDKTEYFYSEDEAFEKYGKNTENGIHCNWGTAEDEEIKTLVGYEKKTIKEKVQDEKWDWKY